MRKPKIQPLIPLILRRGQIVLLLLITHVLPDLIPIRIPLHIVVFNANNYHDIIRQDAQQDLVAPAIQRLVVVAVDVGADDAAGLHAHVVQG